jgi:hypothetical protein
VSRAWLAVLLAGLAAALGACDLSDGGNQKPKPAPKEAEAPSDARVIRAWSRALNAGRFEEAGSYFARNALVDQGQPFRLPNRDAAAAFGRSLPCKGEVTDVTDEGATSLASFQLSRGPGGPCRGRARVRFRIRNGKFTEFRQLPGSQLPPSDSV